jgi:hypothetical protein
MNTSETSQSADVTTSQQYTTNSLFSQVTMRIRNDSKEQIMLAGILVNSTVVPCTYLRHLHKHAARLVIVLHQLRLRTTGGGENNGDRFEIFGNGSISKTSDAEHSNFAREEWYQSRPVNVSRVVVVEEGSADNKIANNCGEVYQCGRSSQRSATNMMALVLMR